MRSSYSQFNTFKKCPKHWDWAYIQKLVRPEMGASLYFGSAIDEAVMALLEGQSDYLQKFHKRWHTSYSFGKYTTVFDNPDVVYAHTDFDPHVLEASDISQLDNWASELGLKNTDGGLELYKAVAKIKKNPYIQLKPQQLKYFNRASWLSLKKKGEILIESFRVQFLPKVTKVISTQQRGELKDPYTGDSIIGYLDMVLEVEGYDKPIILDLKTAARPYTQDTIDLTEQLVLYSAMKSEEYNTNLVGYIVLCKNIDKDKKHTCKTCGNVKSGRHKTCEADIGGSRCGGDWDDQTVLSPKVQFLVREVNIQERQDLLGDYANILLAMKNNVVYKNRDNCTNWYGSKCPYYDACHNNDISDLVKK